MSSIPTLEALENYSRKKLQAEAKASYPGDYFLLYAEPDSHAVETRNQGELEEYGHNYPVTCIACQRTFIAR